MMHRIFALRVFVAIMTVMTMMSTLVSIDGGASVGIGTVRASSAYKTVQKDVTYCTADGVALKMDVYQPSKRDKTPLPAIVYVHGGGWREGDKAGGRMPQLFPLFADQGFVVASINYRLAPEYVFPAQIEDTKCAIRHLRAKADVYGLDPDHIGAWGASAGGHLVALLGTTDASAKLEGDSGYADQSSRVQAVVDWFGPTDFTVVNMNIPRLRWLKQIFGDTKDAHERASPVTYISSDDPPFLIQQGEKDAIVDASQSQLFYDRLVAAKVPAELVMVKNGGHSFTPVGGEISPSMDALLRQVLRFFEKTLKGAS